ncbi:MAG: sulfite exporter TauE/SafE family protein, partial [Planctomycetota bacterium]
MATLTIIGVISGIAGGMLGIGGSAVMIPALTMVLGPNQHLYQAAAMIMNFFVAVPAVYQHSKAGAVDRKAVRRFIPIAAVAVIIGVGLSECSLFAGDREVYLRAAFGLFLAWISLQELIRAMRRATRNPQNLGRNDSAIAPAVHPDMTWRLAAIVAAPCGLIAGLLGVGGGLIAVPLQQRFLHIPIRNAIANSCAMIVATSLVGALAKNYAFITQHAGSMDSLVMASVLVPTAALGSMVGARLTHVLPVRFVKIAFFLLLL